MVASPLRLDRLPLVKSIDRKNAAPPAVGVAKHRQLRDGLALGVDRLASALRVLAPLGDEAPAQWIKRDAPRFVVTWETSSSWLGTPFQSGGKLWTRLSRASSPSTMPSRKGPLL